MEKTRRLREQKWLLDRIIQLQGVEAVMNWIRHLPYAGGMELYVDYAEFKTKVKRYDDIAKELLKIAKRRETMAQKAAADGYLVTARDNYFSAAVCYNVAQMTVAEDDLKALTACNASKNACYDGFIKYAPHPVERVEIPFGDKVSLPGFLHLPARGQQNWPCVVDIGGMEVLKELLHPVYNNKLLERGIAILCFDGPGQGEARLRNIFLDMNEFARAGQAAMDFLIKRSPLIDSGRIGIRGFSLGTRIASQIVANDHRFKAIAVHGSGYGRGGRGGGPGMADPTLKEKLMWMHGFDDEEEYDRSFQRRDNFEGVAPKIQCPYLCVTGENDHISPIEYTYEFFNELKVPKKLMVWEGEGHELRQTCDADALIADWFKDRFDGKPMQSENIYVDLSGREIQKGFSSK